MDDLQDLSIEINLKSIDYLANVNIIENDKKFTIEIQNIQSGEIWKNCFESSYIEDLTRKTGNFKSFPIFINMLYASLRKESNTVTLDILTYNDLEVLRDKNSSNSSARQANNAMKNINNKRYLILTYNVEFDRINYPLQLNYQGVPDPVELLKTINTLKNQLKSYENKNPNEYRSNQMNKLEKENAYLIKDKEFLGLEILKLKSIQQGKNKEMQGQSGKDCNQQEIKVLKQMMKSIEESSIKEKNYFQRQIVKRDEEINELKYEINKIRASEKNLINQIKFSEEKFNRSRSRNTSINNDSLKRKSYNHKNSDLNKDKRSISQESKKRSVSPFINYDYINSKKLPSSHKARKSSENSQKSSNSINNRWRSSSLDRDRSVKNLNGRCISPGNSNLNSRGISPASSINSINSYGSAYSVNGSNKRFNPTDYVKAKNDRLKQAELKKKQEINYKICGKNSNARNSKNSLRTRSRSANSNYSYDGDNNYGNSSFISKNSYISDYMVETSHHHSEYNNKQERIMPRRDANRIRDMDNGLFNRDQEMKEIDDKLKSLQMLIKNTI